MDRQEVLDSVYRTSVDESGVWWGFGGRDESTLFNWLEVSHMEWMDEFSWTWGVTWGVKSPRD